VIIPGGDEPNLRVVDHLDAPDDEPQMFVMSSSSRSEQSR
jgi:hypothetical protein